MAKLQIVAGATSQSVNIFIQDSTSTTGAALTGLVFNSAGLTAYYALPRAAAASITLATLAAVTSAYSSGGFKEIDATNMPGWYRFDIPDAALASGRFVAIHLKGASSMAPLPIEIELTAVNNQDAVRGGMTALPNANAEAAGGLFTRGSGAGQITQSANGQIDVDAKKINSVSTSSVTTINANVGSTQPVNFTGTGASALAKSDTVDIAGAAVSTTVAQIGVNAVNVGGTAQTGRDLGASVLLSSGTGTGQLDFTSGVVKANLAQILGTALTETAGQLAGGFKKFFNIGSPASTMDALTLVATATNLTNAPTSGDFTSTMKTSLNAATPAVTVSDKTGFSLSTAGILAIWHQLTSAIVTASTIGKLLVDNIDAAVSSRSTYAGGDTSGTTTLLSRLTSTRAGLLDHLDADISSRLAGGSYTAPPSAVSIRTEMDSNSTKLANLDVVLSTRLATSGYTTPPTVTAIRSEIDSNSTKLDVAVSTRLASAGYTVPPTVALIRAEMDSNSTKLAHLDVDTSTRLASAGYTTPPTVVAIRSEMDSNSTKLANLDAAITTRATPAQVQTSVASELDAAGVELVAIPTGVSSLRLKLNFIFQYFRMKRTITSDTETMYKENSSTSLGTAAITDDGTTVTKAKVA